MTRHPRYLILPKWIRFFSWLFLVMAAFIIPVLLITVATDIPSTFTLFGFEYRGTALHPTPLLISGCLVFFGYTGYALLWGRPNGIRLGLIAGYLGIAIAVAAFVVGARKGIFMIPLEPFLQVPFIVALSRRRNRWEQSPNQSPEPTGSADSQQASFIGR